MPAEIPEGFVAVSSLSRRAAESAVDRALRTTHDAITFLEALAEVLGPRAWHDAWVRPGGDRRVYAFDPDRPGWLVAQPIAELSLDVPPPPPWANRVLLADGTYLEFGADRPKVQPEGPNQRSAALRLIVGDLVASWTYDEGGRVSERARGRGDGPSDTSLPFLRDARRLDRDAQRPHPVFLRDDLDANGHTAGELAEKVAGLDVRGFSGLRVWMPVQVPGGPALSARRAVMELRRASYEGRWSYPAAGWVIVDGYLGELKATGATFESAWEAWQEAVRAHNPIPRDSRMTHVERERAAADLQRVLEEEEPPGEPTVERDGDRVTMSSRAVIRFAPPVELAFPPRRPECVPAVAIRLPEAPSIPEAWRVAGFDRVVRCLDEQGRCGHGLLAADPDGATWFVGETASRHLDPGALRDRVRRLDGEADRQDLERWGPTPHAPDRPYPWKSSVYTVLAPDGNGVGELRRTGHGSGPAADTSGFEPPAAHALVWSRRASG